MAELLKNRITTEKIFFYPTPVEIEFSSLYMHAKKYHSFKRNEILY